MQRERERERCSQQLLAVRIYIFSFLSRSKEASWLYTNAANITRTVLIMGALPLHALLVPLLLVIPAGAAATAVVALLAD